MTKSRWRAPRRPLLSFGLTALVLLCFLQGQHVLFASLFALVYDSIFPALRPAALGLACLPLLALAGPVLPLARWLGRRRALAAVVLAAAAARLLMAHPSIGLRAAAGTLLVGAGALFLVHTVGYLERRSLSAGTAAAFLLQQLLRLGGDTYDPLLGPRSWLPVGVLAAALVAMLALWLRAPEQSEPETGLERRAAGLRLRGAVMLGLLLFLQQTALGIAAVGARWTGVAHGTIGLLLAGAEVVVLVHLLAGRGPAGRHRPAALVMAVVVAAGVLVPWIDDGWGPALMIVAGHGAGLLLLDRALAPASGRRGAWTLVVGLAVFLLLNVLYAFTFFYAFTVPALQGGLPWVYLAASLLLGMVLLLVPRPPASVPIVRRPRTLGLAAAAGLVALGLALRSAGVDRPPSPMPAAGAVSVATYNVHYGFGQDWRYDPGAMAAAIAASGADVVVLQEVSAGLGTAYGTDLAYWLGRRLRMRAFFAPTINDLVGDAVLSRLPVVGFESQPIPPERADRKQVARLAVRVGRDTLRIYGTHLGLTDEERRAQIEGILSFIAPGRAVLAGDLNAGPDGEVARRLAAAGFGDAFAAVGLAGGPTAPALRPAERIDWVWVRDQPVAGARVLEHTASDHRLVVARLRVRP